MKSVGNYIIPLLLLTILIMAAGYIIVTIAETVILPSDILILPLLFALVTLLTIVVFAAGVKREPRNQTFLSLVALGVKFILEMGLALIWFFVAKKTGAASVVLFFVLYLAFTLFLIFIILNSLKNKSL